MSCSGLQQGEHIINPFTRKPVVDRRVCWVRMDKNSALADALSAAGMMLLLEDPEPTGKTIQWGNWPQE